MAEEWCHIITLQQTSGLGVESLHTHRVLLLLRVPGLARGARQDALLLQQSHVSRSLLVL